MDFDEIERKIFSKVKDGKLCAMKDKYGNINVANGCVMINDLITIRNVYEIYEINGTLWINENTIKTSDVKDFLILGI